VFHTSRPLRASRAATKPPEGPKWSWKTNSLPPQRNGEQFVPWRAGNSPRLWCQGGLPGKSPHNTPAVPKKAETRSPSAGGGAEGCVLLKATLCGGASGANASQSVLPSARFRQRTERRLPWSWEVVRKIRSPQMTGEELPRPGKSTAQRTLSVSDQRSG